MKKILSLLLVLAMVLMHGTGALALNTIQDCHRFKASYTDTKKANASVVRLWQVKTALPQVDEQLDAVVRSYAETLGDTLPKADNTTSRNSRLDVGIRCSRTGLSWMSFLVQARVTYHRDLTAQYITAMTFDMETGEQITLTDIFDDENSAVWMLMAAAVSDTVTNTFPGYDPDRELLEAYVKPESLRNIAFTLQGMSLVLHVPADLFYPEYHFLIEVPLYYPDIREYMSDEAWVQTDNLSYYKTAALTFDDGPVRVNTTRMLNTLMEHGAVATFFVIGNRITEFADLIQRENDEGHAIGYHNWHHGNATKSSGSALREMVKRCDDALIAAIGKPANYDRVPYGLYPAMQDAHVAWPYIQWSLDTYDWRGLSSSAVLSAVKKQISDGDIILCHDIKPNTADSAALIADYLAEQGYLLLTIDELMAKDSVTLQNGTVYYRCVNGDTSRK